MISNPPVLAEASALEIFILGGIILASSIAYIVWLVKRKL